MGTFPLGLLQTSPGDDAVGLGDPSNDVLGDVALDVEDVLGCKFTVIALRPLMGTARGVGELRS